MFVVVGGKGQAAASLRLNTTPAAFQYPGSEKVLCEFRHIVTVVFLPAGGDPVLDIGFHAGTITLCLVLSKACRFRLHGGVRGAMAVGVHPLRQLCHAFNPAFSIRFLSLQRKKCLIFALRLRC